MENFAAIDFETANGRRSSVCAVGIVAVRGGEVVGCNMALPCHQLHVVAAACGYDLENHHHALADAEACAAIALKIL